MEIPPDLLAVDVRMGNIVEIHWEQDVRRLGPPQRQSNCQAGMRRPDQHSALYSRDHTRICLCQALHLSGLIQPPHPSQAVTLYVDLKGSILWWLSCASDPRYRLGEAEETAISSISSSTHASQTRTITFMPTLGPPPLILRLPTS